jgi:hypothetical protein
MNLQQLKQLKEELKNELLKIKWCRGPIFTQPEDGVINQLHERYHKIKNTIQVIENEMEWEIDA